MIKHLVQPLAATGKLTSAQSDDYFANSL